MKKYLILLLLLTMASQIGVAQNSALNSINAQLRKLFVNLAKPSPSLKFLYDMAAHESDSVFFATNCTDTLETDMWFKIYEEMYHAAYDTTSYTIPDTLFAHANGYYSDTVPVGIMAYSFYKFRDEALSTGIYLDFDTVNTKITDHYPRPDYPYLDTALFVAAPLLRSSYFSNPVFRIDPQFIFFDPVLWQIFADGKVMLKIDFADGNGWIQFDPTKVTNYQVNYSIAGPKTIKTGLFDEAGNEYESSQARYGINTTRDAVPPDEVINTDGISAGVYYSCNATGITGRTVIYLEGFDALDIVPSLNRTIDQIYSDMISSDKLVQLKNEGYNFLVVDWARSTIDIRFNALYLVNLIEYLKCQIPEGDEEQFVIMGESMGGLIGRYALTFMESKYYTSDDYSPFFQDQLDINNIVYLDKHPSIYQLPAYSCDKTRMHRTRLFISLDTPHQGANIPLSIQFAYRQFLSVFGGFCGLPSMLTTTAFNIGLEGQAAQQMLIYHVDTKYGSPWYYKYKSMPEKYQFFTQLKNLGNYPVFAKVMAMSNGSLAGEGQSNYYLSTIYNIVSRQAGDRLIDFHTSLYARVLGIPIPIFGGDLQCYTNPDGDGHLYRGQAGTYMIHIKLKWFGIKVTTGYSSLLYKDEYANTLPYCVNAGGRWGDAEFLSSVPSTDAYNVSGNWILNFFSYDHTVTGDGCVTYDMHMGLNGFFSNNFHLSLCSDGFQFCFVPVQSALDYGVLGTIALNHNIEGESINTKLGKVPADVICGIPTKYSNGYHTYFYPNFSHLFLRNDYIFNIKKEASPSNFEYTYFSCIDHNDAVERGLLNLEIGDEELYLENVTLPWTAKYQAEYDLHVNDRNPYYEYPSSTTSYTLTGIYSRQDPFYIVGSGFAKFYFDQAGTPGIGFSYSAPTSTEHEEHDEPLNNCCIDFIGHRNILNFLPAALHETSLTVYPNPNDGSQLTFNVNFEMGSPASIEVYNGLGNRVITTQVSTDEINTDIHFDLSPFHLPAGIYFIKATNRQEQLFTKLIIVK